MNTIKTYIFNNFKPLSIISICCLISMFLLMIRLKLTHSFFYLFLVWNLLLAAIPFAITTYLKNRKSTGKLLLSFGFCFWLLFLPNAPYIVSDLIHLRLSHPSIIWFDVIMIGTFAISGLLLFYYSLLDMKLILTKYLQSKTVNTIISLILILTSFGVYLGRILRYNSWEIISNPLYLINDIFKIISQPHQHLTAWWFTISFSISLYAMKFAFETLLIKEKRKNNP